MMKKYVFFGFFILLLSACNSKSEEVMPTDNTDNIPTVTTTLYFPPTNSSEWKTTSPESLGWGSTELTELYNYLEANNSRALIILKDGKIVVEKYWGNKIQNNGAFDQDSFWYWASAGKSLTAFLVGIAQQKNLLDINDKTSDYLGENWTSLPLEKENLITVKHQLTMTTGLEYQVNDLDCTDPACLQYRVDAGEQWYYHNGPYTLVEKVVANASQKTYNDFTDEEVEAITGMNGSWIQSNFNNVYWSTARDMARFGLLILNKGTWDETPILTDSTYFQAMINSSQELNPAYGYLWWLNGKSSFVSPGLPNSFNRSLVPNAPADLFAALGKYGQFIDIVPSQNLIVIRMGDVPDESLVPITFHDEMWAKIMEVIE